MQQGMKDVCLKISCQSYFTFLTYAKYILKDPNLPLLEETLEGVKVFVLEVVVVDLAVVEVVVGTTEEGPTLPPQVVNCLSDVPIAISAQP